MSGIMNTTGAVSGILGTTVGTPAATNAADVGAGVLPVGVTGGSGLTALGTVTAGNISNAAIVYPAGHIIQVAHDEEDGALGVTTTSWDTRWSAGPSIVFTPLLTTSNILITFYTQGYKSTDGYASYDFWTDASDRTATFNPSGESYGRAQVQYTAGWVSLSYQWLDLNAENSLTAKTYQASVKGSDSSTTYVGSGDSIKSTMTIMEIVT